MPSWPRSPSPLTCGVRADDHRHEQGSVTPFVVVTALALMLAVGLVADGGQKLQALQRADTAAEEAARAAGQTIQPARSIRGLPPLVDAGPATAAAQAHLTAAGMAGTVSIDGDVVTVSTTTSEPTVFLAAIGITTVTATGSAQARLVRGLDEEVP